MGLTLLEVLVRTLKKLDDSSFQRFIEKLSAQKVSEEYKKISKDYLTGKDPEQVAGLINLYYSYAYGAEVTLGILEDIGQKKVREELQQDLREVDVSEHGLGTAMFTDGVLFINNHQSDLITRITDVDPVLRDLRDQDVLTEQQYNDVMEKTTSQEKMEDLCDIIRYREQTQKYTAYRVLREYKKEVIEHLEMEDRKRRNIYSRCFRGHVVDRNKSYLINDIEEVQPVLEDLRSHHLLTEEQYKDLQVMTTPKEKMSHLVNIFCQQSDNVKDQFYISLWRYNFTVINKLEKAEKVGKRPKGGSHFIDRHKEQLIAEIRDVYRLIYDLHRRDLLTTEQLEDIMKMPSTEEQMRRLYDIISDWDEDEKEEVYFSLYKLIPWIIKQLKRWEDSSSSETSGNHFIDRHKEQLIAEIRNADDIIHDLYWRDLLTTKQRDDIMKMPRTNEKMRRLYDIISDWDDDEKQKVYVSLHKFNPRIIKKLKKSEYSSSLETGGDHFIDRHKEQLIAEIRDVDDIIHDLYWRDLLTSEEYYDIKKIRYTEQKMRHLYDIISDWDEDEKQQVYVSLQKFNPRIIKKLKKSEDSSSLETGGDHFIDRYKEQLITGVRDVDHVIVDLYHRDLVTTEQRNALLDISDTEEQMRRLYDIISDWDDNEKQEVYVSLYKHNPRIIQDLKKSEDSSTLETISKLLSTISDELEDEVSKPFTLMKIEENIQRSPSEASTDTEAPQTSLEEVTADSSICKLCGEDQDVAEVVSSTVGSMYRLELKSPGLYRCQKTGIKFLVKGPIIIDYKLDSWSDHLKDIPDNSYEILGPLFNIQTSGEPDAVSAVYLPHFLCLKAYSEDKALIKCAHLKDGNMTLETPTQIEPFYIILENPTFSCLGPLLPFRKKKTPIHGSVLIYFTILCQGDPDEEHRIHFYVLPNYRNAEQIQALDDENIKFGFHRIKKPEHTATVYTKVKYLVSGHPRVSANPQDLMFQTQSYQFTEIQLQEKIADIFLKLCEEKSEDPVWKADLTQRDIKNFKHLQSRLTVNAGAGAGPSPQHFVDRHIEALIQRTSNISPVLDNLLSERLLTQEQYDILRVMTPHQVAMRQLYVYMTIWGDSDKDKLYQALKTYDGPLIRDLENPVIL